MRRLVLVCAVEKLRLRDFEDKMLDKGDKIEVSEGVIQNHPDLQKALDVGALVVEEVRRQPRVRDTSRRPVRQRPKPKKVVNTSTLEDRLKGMIVDALRDNLGDIVSAIESSKVEVTLSEQPQVQAGGVDADTIRAIMSEVVASMPKQQVVVQGNGSSSTQAAAQMDDTPMFIPTGIVSNELEAEIDTASESSKGSSVDAATEALRQLRKAKKNKES
tara:strand:- start:119 stop:769 length:651 start_codon:yes stop_codon:yes gene_type:complete